MICRNARRGAPGKRGSDGRTRAGNPDRARPGARGTDTASLQRCIAQDADDGQDQGGLISSYHWGRWKEAAMKWTGIYFLGYVIFMGGLFGALWKLGVLEKIGMTWTVIGIVIAIGFGIMIAVSGSGEKKVVEVDDKR
jgi:hypothetical protein